VKASIRITAFFCIFAFALAQTARANLVQNGDFSSVTYTGPGTAAGHGLTTLFGQFGSGTPSSGQVLAVTSWSTGGYNFVFAPGTADSGTKAGGANTGAPKEAVGEATITVGGKTYGNTYLWGPNNGSSNGLSGPPGGGNFLALDGAYEQDAVEQTITGLTVNQTYALTFYWAGAQQESYTGITTDKLTVKLGSATGVTSTITVPSEGFSGWMQQTFYFQANSTSEVLSFLAAGTPNGEPPFALIANVDLEVVPDSSNWMIFGAFGVGCVVFEVARRRRRSALASAALE